MATCPPSSSRLSCCSPSSPPHLAWASGPRRQWLWLGVSWVRCGARVWGASAHRCGASWLYGAAGALTTFIGMPLPVPSSSSRSRASSGLNPEAHESSHRPWSRLRLDADGVVPSRPRCPRRPLHVRRHRQRADRSALWRDCTCRGPRRRAAWPHLRRCCLRLEETNGPRRQRKS